MQFTSYWNCFRMPTIMYITTRSHESNSPIHLVIYASIATRPDSMRPISEPSVRSAPAPNQVKTNQVTLSARRALGLKVSSRWPTWYGLHQVPTDSNSTQARSLAWLLQHGLISLSNLLPHIHPSISSSRKTSIKTNFSKT